MAAHRCIECGAVIPPRVGRGRPRTMCEACSPTRRRKPASKAAAVVELPAATGPLYAATMAMLEEAGRQNTPKGIVALGLAVTFDAREDGAAARSALAKQFNQALDDAMENAPRAADLVDELQSRRNARRA